MRLIDADALMRCIPNEDITSRFAVENAPTIEAEPIRHGKWIKMSDTDGDYYACSECGEELYREWSFDREFDIFPRKRSIDKTQFCSHCGALMDLKR